MNEKAPRTAMQVLLDKEAGELAKRKRATVPRPSNPYESIGDGRFKMLLNHWREFGPDHGFDELIETLATSSPPRLGMRYRTPQPTTPTDGQILEILALAKVTEIANVPPEYDIEIARAILAAAIPQLTVPKGCVWAVTKGGDSICQPPKNGRWEAALTQPAPEPSSMDYGNFIDETTNAATPQDSGGATSSRQPEGWQPIAEGSLPADGQFVLFTNSKNEEGFGHFLTEDAHEWLKEGGWWMAYPRLPAAPTQGGL